MSSKINKTHKPFQADEAMDELMKAMTPKNDSISEALKAMSRYRNGIEKIYKQGFNEGYESALRQLPSTN